MEQICKLKFGNLVILFSILFLFVVQDKYCSSYGLNFTYRVNITAERSSLIEDNTTVRNYVTNFENIGTESGVIDISILGVNELGMSDLITYPYAISKLL